MKKRLVCPIVIIIVISLVGIGCDPDEKGETTVSNDSDDRIDRFGSEDVSVVTRLLTRPEATSVDLGAAPLIEVPRLSMPFIDNNALIVRDRYLTREHGKQGILIPVQTTEPIHVDITPAKQGVWEQLVDGSWLWRLTIESTGAYSISLGMSRCFMPEGAKLFVYSADQRSVRGPFTAKDNHSHGQLWLPLVPGDEIVVELNVPDEKRDQVELRITSVNHDYKRFGVKHDNGEAPIFTEDSPACEDNYPDGCPVQRGCNVDVECIGVGNDPWGDLNQNLPAGVSWTTVKRSVGQMEIAGGVCNCSGTLVNNAAEDGRLFFITASHCFRICENDRDVPFDEGLASVKVYWNYEQDDCRDYTDFSDETFDPDGATNQVTIGGADAIAEFRYGHDVRDFILLELKGSVLGYDVRFAGWDRSGATPPTTVGIHHPTAQEKRISVDLDSATIEGNMIWAAKNDGWENGIMQHGSSGSPLFDTSGRVVGGALSTSTPYDYSQHDCSQKNTKYFNGGYARMSSLWNGIGQFLDPEGGATTLDGKDADDLDCHLGLTGTISSGNYDGCYVLIVDDATVYNGSNVSLTADHQIQIKKQTRFRNGSSFSASID